MVDQSKLMNLPPEGIYLTIFAFPTCLLNDNGLPDDPEILALLGKYQEAGITFGFWSPDELPNITYVATPDQQTFAFAMDAIHRLDKNGEMRADETMRICHNVFDEHWGNG